MSNRAAATEQMLPDDACLKLGIERFPAGRGARAGACRLHDEVHPPTGRRCISALSKLGGEHLELSGCYRSQRDGLTLDYAEFAESEAEVVFLFDGKQCWIVGKTTWAGVDQRVKAFLMTTTGCTGIREDYVF